MEKLTPKNTIKKTIERTSEWTSEWTNERTAEPASDRMHGRTRWRWWRRNKCERKIKRRRRGGTRSYTYMTDFRTYLYKWGLCTLGNSFSVVFRSGDVWERVRAFSSWYILHTTCIRMRVCVCVCLIIRSESLMGIGYIGTQTGVFLACPMPTLTHTHIHTHHRLSRCTYVRMNWLDFLVHVRNARTACTHKWTAFFCQPVVHTIFYSNVCAPCVYMIMIEAPDTTGLYFSTLHCALSHSTCDCMHTFRCILKSHFFICI